MPEISFTTVPQPNPGGVLFIEVPEHVVSALGERKRPPVKVTMNGHSYRSTIAVYGDKFYLPARREVREAAKLEVGKRVTVRLALDTETRTVAVPPELARAIARDKKAKAAFTALSFSHRREYVEWITEAKREETRAGRVEKTITALREGKRARASDRVAARRRADRDRSAGRSPPGASRASRRRVVKHR